MEEKRERTGKKPEQEEKRSTGWNWRILRDRGTDHPLLCVPIVASNRAEIIAEVKRLALKGPDLLEWRMDWFDEADSIERVLQVLAEIVSCRGNMGLLCTFRSLPQGGKREIVSQDYRNLLLAAAKSGNADLIDVEVCEYLQARTLIGEIHQQSRAAVVASDHNFHATPSTEIMLEKLQYMKQVGADIGKLAVMPKSPSDVLHLMEASARMKECEPAFPIVSMSMGSLGAVSRIAGSLSGSCITFASAGRDSAPGQLLLEDIRDILDKLAESAGREDEA